MAATIITKIRKQVASVARWPGLLWAKLSAARWQP